MFTDMVGYTALGQKNESLSLALVEEQRKLLRPIFTRHNGREIKTIGDAFLVEFPSALDAVRCAYDIQRATREFNVSLPSEERVRLRIGVHLGDIVESQGDISGDAVNVASRIESLAEDGGVCLTRQVYDHIQNKFELPLTSLGTKLLKNVSAPLEVYKIVMPWSEGKAIPSTQLDKGRIAVLPFANISPDPADEYFADGMTEELITKLSEIGELRVIARTSVMNYKKKEKNVSEIGRELRVGYIIEGSVRKAGNRVRVTVQLIDSHNEEHLWASTYDREFDDIFAIQSDIASRVASSLLTGVFPKAQRKDTDDVQAYTLYIRAMQLYHEDTEPSLREAIALFDQAISRDRRFVRAYAGLAHTWGRMASAGYEDFTVAIGKTEVAARKALELGSDWAEAHAAMADVNYYMDRFEEAVAEAEKAIQINPSLSQAYLSLGGVYSTMGRLDEGLKAYRRANELDPLSYSTGGLLALVSRVSGRELEALDVLGRLRELNPRNPRVYVGLAECYMLKRDFAEAQEMLNIGLQISLSEPLLLLNQGLLYAFTGRRKEAEEALQVMMNNERESVRLYGQLFIQAALGNLDEAFKALMRQTETHSWPFLIKYLPVFEGLRKDPRFIEFCLKMGLPT